MFQAVCLTVIVLAQLVHGLPPFQKRIPNGNRVPDPCRPGEIWPAVGHLPPPKELIPQIIAGQIKYHVTANPFGADFKAAGFQWTTELCEMDSDGDGKTNGEELGDPDCVWYPTSENGPADDGENNAQEENSEPDTDSSLSHPGYCEPVDSAKCMLQNMLFLNSTNCPALAEVLVPNPWKLAKGCTCYCLNIPSNAQRMLVGIEETPYGSPQINTPEFRQTDRYAVGKSCKCACPRTQTSG